MRASVVTLAFITSQVIGGLHLHQAALSVLARMLVDKRGYLDDHDVTGFLEAGLGRDHLLEVIAIVAASAITHQGGNVTPLLERSFQPYRWHAVGV